MVRINKITLFLYPEFAQKIHLTYSFVRLGFRPHQAPTARLPKDGQMRTKLTFCLPFNTQFGAFT
ncbi:hypothetical protein PROVRUST_08405 [Providencia rustigianii DSM 4541]|uniref:Uncharacterized protein n=1 Tax=Providencia rustigianii DSM 4541 TaxID=500637 RepID=D1P824_9GAMM|nr:hypothetical protein PROVRUST_08405 [Providencia rustigianii DSM 4541]